MRRLVAVLALGAVAALGFGSAYVLAQTSSAFTKGGVGICHSGNGKHFEAESPDANGVLSGHRKHAHDIIPPFELIEGGTTTNFPGQNMGGDYGAGFTGAEVLANACKVPSGGATASTTTVTTSVSETVPEKVTVPAAVETFPATTVTTTVSETVSVPIETLTAPGESLTVTVPPGETVTVSVHAETTTIPAKTVTVGGGVVAEPEQVVVVPGTTQTLTGTTETTVTTVSAPPELVERGGVLAAQSALTLREPRRVVRVRAHVIRTHVGKKRLVKKVIVYVVRPSRDCPPGTNPYRGGCSRIVRGRG